MPIRNLSVGKRCGKRFGTGHFKLRKNLQNIQWHLKKDLLNWIINILPKI